MLPTEGSRRKQLDVVTAPDASSSLTLLARAQAGDREPPAFLKTLVNALYRWVSETWLHPIPQQEPDEKQ